MICQQNEDLGDAEQQQHSEHNCSCKEGKKKTHGHWSNVSDEMLENSLLLQISFGFKRSVMCLAFVDSHLHEELNQIWWLPVLEMKETKSFGLAFQFFVLLPFALWFSF